MPRERQAGLLVPLFSIASRESWGVGEIPDIVRIAGWMRGAGLSLLQVLPVNEMAEGQNSPYSALSAMAVDPIFIAPSAVPDVAALGGESMLEEEERAALTGARQSDRVEYATVRRIKTRVFRAAFERFLTDERAARTVRADRFERFLEREGWWVDEYALFRAIHAREHRRHWREWPAELRDRNREALARTRAELADDILLYQYLQWLAHEQWEDVRRTAGIGIYGDFPFMVSGDSADVWSRQQDFRMDASVGAPPDAFSETGQDWGFPAYRWREIAAGGYEWLAQRARRSAELYDGFRVDHLVGFFRTYVRESDGRAAFVPAEPPEQAAQGERLLELFKAPGSRVIAEDLGVIPDFVREILTRANVPGYKVLRWEREWEQEGQPFRDPRSYPACAVATTGTHDTETVAEWWDTAPADERKAMTALESVRQAGCDAQMPFGPQVRDAFLTVLFASGADILLLPIHDVFGWRDRINTPAVIDARNWTWRLPWPVEDLQTEPVAQERAAFLREQAEKSGRQ